MLALHEQAKPMKIPTLDLSRQYERLRPEILAAIETVCASQHYILGSDVAAFERELASFTGAAEAVGCELEKTLQSSASRKLRAVLPVLSKLSEIPITVWSSVLAVTGALE